MGVPAWPVRAQVIAHDAANDALVVMLSSGQTTGFNVSMMYHGSADGLRLSKKALPSRGTWGLVVFPNGDTRNGMWLGAYHPNLQNAIPSDANDPFMEYESHFSGHFRLLDQFGNHTESYADGSTHTVNSSGGAVPTVYRNIVDQNQKQQRVPFKYSDRVATPPPPFAHSFVQAVSGNLGGASYTVGPSGDITVTCATTGHAATVTYNGTTVQIDANGSVQATVKSGQFFVITGNLHVTGAVVAGFGGADSVTLQGHVHAQGPDSHGDTEVPTNAPTAGT